MNTSFKSPSHHNPSNLSFSDTGNMSKNVSKQLKYSTSFKKEISNLNGDKNSSKFLFFSIILVKMKDTKHSLNPPEGIIQLQSMEKNNSKMESVSSISSSFSGKIESFKLSPEEVSNKGNGKREKRVYVHFLGC